MRKERNVWLSLILLAGQFAPFISGAQDSLRNTQLNDVVITATKFPKNIHSTAKVLTVIGEDQLARSAGKDVSQLLNEQAGLIINGANSSPGKDKGVYLQGASSGYTLILLDGIPLNDPSGVGGAFDLRLLPVDQIERIEILKGSQSTLYGTDAIAGVINIITRKKGEKPIGASGTFSYGSYNTFKGNIGVSGSTSALDYHVGYTHFTTDGISEAKDPDGTGNFDKDGYRQDAVQANVSWKASNSLFLKPYFRYNNFVGQYDANAFTDSNKDTYTSYLLNTGLSAQYLFPKGGINLLYGFDKTDRTFDSDFGISRYQGRFQHGEGFVNYNINNRLQLLAGVSYQRLHMLDSAATSQNPVVTIASPYASLFLKNLKGFSLEFGGRYNRHSKFGNTFTYSFNPSYLLNSQAKFFLNVSSGFKAPTLSQLFGQYGPNPDLKPEKSQSLEAGIQLFSRNRKMDVRLTAFQRNLTDVIYYSFDPITFQSKYINLNKQNDSGFEAELGVNATAHLTIRGFYNYVDGFLLDKSGGSEVKTYNLIRRPRNSFGVHAGFQATSAFFASINLKTFGKRSDLYFNSTTFATENVTLEPYYLLDVYLEYKLNGGRVKIFVDAKNLLNQDYMEVYGYNTLKLNMMSGLNITL